MNKIMKRLVRRLRRAKEVTSWDWIRGYLTALEEAGLITQEEGENVYDEIVEEKYEKD